VALYTLPYSTHPNLDIGHSKSTVTAAATIPVSLECTCLLSFAKSSFDADLKSFPMVCSKS